MPDPADTEYERVYEAAPLPEPIEDDPEYIEAVLLDAQRSHTFGVIGSVLDALREQRVSPVRGLYLIENEARMARQHFAELDADAETNRDDNEDGDYEYGGNAGRDYGHRRVGIRRAARGGLYAGAGRLRRMAHGNEEFRQIMPALQKQADAAMEGKTEDKIRALTNALGDAKQMRLDARKADARAPTVAEDALIVRLQSRLTALLDATDPDDVDSEPRTLADVCPDKTGHIHGEAAEHVCERDDPLDGCDGAPCVAARTPEPTPAPGVPA